jgi:transcriptional regulator with XRE-family HTH domain
MGGEADDLVRDVGRRVAELRIRLGLTQEELAERLDVLPRYVQRAEAGKVNFTLRSLHRWADVLGVAVAKLFAKPRIRPTRPGRPTKRSKPRSR